MSRRHALPWLLVALSVGSCSPARTGVDQVRELARTTRSLAGLNLTGLDLTGLDLRAVDLRGADLEGAKLDRADLSGAKLSEANMKRASLIETSLREADLRDANLMRANLLRADLSGANLSEAELDEAKMAGAVLRGANLTKAELERVDLRGADLRQAVLREADLTGARLDDADLGDADLESADLEDASFLGANLCGANLFGAAVPGTKFAGARFAAPTSNTWRPTFPRETLSFLAVGTTVRDEVVRRLQRPVAKFEGGRIAVYHLVKHKKGLWVSLRGRRSADPWGTEEYSLILVYDPDGRLRRQTLRSMKTLEEDGIVVSGATDPLAFLVDGKTSKAEVLDRLGLPSAEFEGERILTYRIGTGNRGAVVTPRNAGDWKDVEYSLVLVFDEQHVLRRHARVKVG